LTRCADVKRRDRIVGFAQRQRLPAIYHFREYAAAGGHKHPSLFLVLPNICN
jgi:hypothetical protein